MNEKDYHKEIRLMQCVACGDAHAEVAHYSGKYSDQLGKGTGRKSWFHCCAALCRKCHLFFDNYEDGNDDSRAAMFMLMILKTQHVYLMGKEGVAWQYRA